jgi:hypothetical protein
LLFLIAAALFLAFFTFPIVHTRWGDAYLLSKSMGWPDPTLRLTHSWQAPLDVYLHALTWRILHAPLRWEDAAPVYRWLSPLAGAIYLTAALALSRKQQLAPAWLTFGALASLGVMQLFFGYIENYSFAAAGILVYLWLALDALAGQRPLWQATLALAVTNAFHPSTIVLVPSLLYVAWRVACARTRGNKSTLAIVFEVALPMVGMAVAVLALMELGGHGVRALLTTDRPGGGDASWLVPIWAVETRWQHYTMLSWPHLRDMLNEQLLSAPVVLPSLLVIGLLWIMRIVYVYDKDNSRTDPHAQDSEARQDADRSAAIFLAIAAFCYLLFIWVWNPDYGGQRDWDLFSLAAIPLTLAWVWLLARLLDRRYLIQGVAPLLLLQALHTAAWIYQNTLPWEWPS